MKNSFLATVTALAVFSSTQVKAAHNFDNCGVRGHYDQSPHCALQYQFCMRYPNFVYALRASVDDQMMRHGVGIDMRDVIAQMIYGAFAYSGDPPEIINVIGNDNATIAGINMEAYIIDKQLKVHPMYVSKIMDDCTSGTLDFIDNDGRN